MKKGIETIQIDDTMNLWMDGWMDGLKKIEMDDTICRKDMDAADMMDNDKLD